MSQTDLQQLVRDNAHARLNLASVLERVSIEAPLAQGAPLDVIITPNEVNGRHGTGVLVKRLFGHCPDILAIRSRNIYGADQQFGKVAFCLPHPTASRQQSFFSVMRALDGLAPRRILCIPYYYDDVMTALAVKELFNVPLCTWIMDDQNISVQVISDELMGELLAKSSLRLAISPELQRAYQDKYDLPLHFLPPVVPDALLSTSAQVPPESTFTAPVGLIIGNIWSDRWLELLRRTVRGTSIQVCWYWTGGSWLDRRLTERAALEEDGILLRTPIETEEGLVADLRTRPFTVVPSGTLDAADDNPAISRLSLPSRIVFNLATSNTPIIILGSEQTAAARFVRRYGVGTVSSYEPESFKQAVAFVCEPANRRTLRENAARLAASLAASGTAEWIWRSLAAGAPCDDRFNRFDRDG